MGPKHPAAARFLHDGLFEGLTCFSELEQRISVLENTKVEGDAFEVFAEAYLATQKQSQAEQIWPSAVLPEKLRLELIQPTREKGADGFYISKSGEYGGYQVKFRKGRPNLTWDELGNFFGITSKCKERLVFTNTDTISQSYREVARDKKKFTGENKDFIAAKLNSANWMIQAIEQRRQTMLKVMSFIVDRQRDFLERGVQHLKPLTLREVADHIEMHESTVSRVTNKKFVQTPRGVYSLKYFFSSGLSTTGGEQLSAVAVKDKIKVMVTHEDPTKPHTDQAIV